MTGTDGRRTPGPRDASPPPRARARAFRVLVVVAGAIGLMAAVGVLLLAARSGDRSTDALERDERAVAGMEAAGYRRTAAAEGRASVGSPDVTDEVLFVGHIYPRSGFEASAPHTATLSYFDRFVVDRAPARVVLGGDNVRRPTADELRRLDRLISGWPSRVRAILGNHEAYWDARGDSLFERLFEPRFGFEDHDGVRLVWLHTDVGGGRYGLDAEQTSFLGSALSGGYRYALVFLHHALWAGETTFANEAYTGAAAMARGWSESTLPLLRDGRVRGVFSGDGGVNRQGGVSTIGGIPHFVTGWPGVTVEHLPEWLVIRLLEQGIEVTSFLLAGDVLLHKGVWGDDPGD